MSPHEQDGEQVFPEVRQRAILDVAIRMPTHRADAEDAMQEILTRIVTDLGSIEGIGLGDTGEAIAHRQVKIGCTLAMFTCLSRKNRMAYILCESSRCWSARRRHIVNASNVHARR